MSAIVILRRMAQIHGLTIIERTNGHIQITGGHLLVNYLIPNKEAL